MIEDGQEEKCYNKLAKYMRKGWIYMRFMKRWRIFASVFLTICITISLTACGSKEKENAKAEEEGSMGRYVEEDVVLPEGELLSLNTLTDGRLRVLCSTGVYDSADKGDTWTPWEKQPEELTVDLTLEEDEEKNTALAGFCDVRDAVMGKGGELFYLLIRDGKFIYKYMDREGRIFRIAEEERDKNKPRSMIGISFTDAGELLYEDIDRNIVLLDCKDNKVKHNFEVQANHVVAVGERLYLIRDTAFDINVEIDENTVSDEVSAKNTIEMDVYNLVTYEKVEESQAFLEFLRSGEGMEGGTFGMSLVEGEDGKSVYIVNISGIYRYTADSSVVEKVFDGNLGRMNSETVTKGTVLDKDHLFLMYFGQWNDELVRYAFNPDIPSVPENELTVYSLYDNYQIRSAITEFREANPDVYIEYETAMTGDDVMTVSDAIKTLNTNIMAGEGPDVLILEGMPVESYAEKGLLLDTSDVLREVSDDEGLFENIVYAYETEGKVFAVPTRFSVPVMMCRKGSAEKVSDFDTFLRMAEEQHKSGKPSVYTEMDSYSLLKIFLTTSSPEWIQEDGSLDKEALTEFLTGVQMLADFNPTPLEERWGTEMDEGLDFELAQFMTTGECYLQYLLKQDTDFNVFQMKDSQNLFRVTSAIKQLGVEEYTYVPAPGQASNIFVPMDSVGISAKSQNAETAKRFLKWLISADSTLSEGWPVNKKDFADGMVKEDYVTTGHIDVEEDTGDKYSFESVWPEKDDFEEFRRLAESLDTPCVTDEIVNRTVLTEGSEFLQGNKSLEEAVDNIMSSLNLYMSE